MLRRPNKLVLLGILCAIPLLSYIGLRSADKAIVTAPPAIRGSDTKDNLPLHQAVKAQDAAKVRSLLDEKVDVNAEDEIGITPLIEATLSGNESIVKMLMDAGAPAQPSEGFRHTPLRAACLTGNVRLIKILLEAGADPNAKSEGMRTPLMGACFLRPGFEAEKSLPAVKAMLEDSRTDPTIANSFGETALDLCEQRKYNESLELLKDAVTSRIPKSSMRL